MAAADLQRQCSELLNQLKVNQTSLWLDLTTSSGPTSLDNNLETHLFDKKPEYARQKLKSIIKNKDGEATGTKEPYRSGGATTAHVETVGSSAAQCPSRESNATAEDCLRPDKNGKLKLIPGEKDEDSDTDAMQEYFESRTSKLKLIPGEKDEDSDTDAMQEYFESRTTASLMDGGTDSFLSGPGSCEDNTRPQRVEKPTTPTAVRRRRIIDRNVHVDSKLSDADLEELEKDTRGLNFSYSQNMQGDDGQRAVEKGKLVEDGGEEKKEEDRTENPDLTYQKSLVDRGNNRQLNNFIRDTTIKPKTILNSTQSFSTTYSKQGPGVSFQNSSANASGTSSLFRSQAKERHMLGYDWIAALVGNDTGLMDESESYFQELREFRRSNRDECCNDFYMEGPFTLTQSEPPAVEKAITDTKVQPYTVNDRLFTVPVTENLLGEPLNPDSREKVKDTPTQDNPRFVRVSIPRATLQMPYRVQPHRRRSFDASDSCSLTDENDDGRLTGSSEIGSTQHCLMGWNAVSPAALPTASSVSLTDAMTGVNPKHTTTLAEAEKAAAMYHWPLLMDPSPHVQPPLRPDPVPTWRKQYMDSTLNFRPRDPSSLSLSSSLDGGGGQIGAGNVQRRTDELLNSTYSMMYQMQKTRETRKAEEQQWRMAGKTQS